jgi:hypothetical protein
MRITEFGIVTDLSGVSAKALPSMLVTDWGITTLIIFVLENRPLLIVVKEVGISIEES